MTEKTPCPLCQAELKHTVENGTHMYKCDECPFMGFEFWQDKDAQNMLKSLVPIYVNR